MVMVLLGYTDSDAFQVLRHPWIVERDQLSDKCLTRQDPLIVKVRPFVLYVITNTDYNNIIPCIVLI